MEQIYNFEGMQPPVLDENSLRRELHRRKQRIAALKLMLGSIFALICIGLFASLIAPTAGFAAAFLIIYVSASVIGGGTFALCYALKGGATI